MKEPSASEKYSHDTIWEYCVSTLIGSAAGAAALVTTVRHRFWDDVKGDAQIEAFRERARQHILEARQKAVQQVSEVALHPGSEDHELKRAGKELRRYVTRAIEKAKKDNHVLENEVLERMGYRSIGWWRRHTLGTVDRLSQMKWGSRAGIVLTAMVSAVVTGGSIQMFFNNHRMRNQITELDRQADDGHVAAGAAHSPHLSTWHYLAASGVGLLGASVAATKTIHHQFEENMLREPEAAAMREKKRENIKEAKQKAQKTNTSGLDPITEGKANRGTVNKAVFEAKTANAEVENRLYERMGYRSLNPVRKYTLGTIDRFHQLSPRNKGVIFVNSVVSAGLTAGGLLVYFNNQVINEKMKELGYKLDHKEAQKQL